MPTLETIRTITIRAQTQGVATAANDLNQLAQAQTNVAQTATTSSKATISVANALERQQRALDATYRSQQQFASTQRTLDRALSQGLIDQDRHNTLMGLASKRLDEASKNQHAFGEQTKLTRYELINLSRQMQDVVVGLASGQKFFTILIQQGTQIGDVFASSGVGLRGFIATIASFITPVTLLVVGIIALTAALIAGIAAWKSYALQLDETARRVGLTLDQLSRLQSAFAFKGVSTEEFTKFIQGVSEQTYLARNNLGAMIELFRANGLAAGDVAKNMENLATIAARIPNDQKLWNVLQNAGLQVTDQIIRRLREGPEALRQAQQEAVGMNKEQEALVKRARDFEEQWRKTIENLKVWIINLIADILSFILKAGPAFWEALKKSFQAAKWEDVADTFWQKFKEGSERTKIEVTKVGIIEGQDPAALKRANQEIIDRVNALGDLATITEKVAAKRAALNNAELEGLKISKQQKEDILEVTRLREISNIIQQRAGLGVLTIEQALIEVENQLVILQKTHVLGTEDLARARQHLTIETLRLVPAVRDAMNASDVFVNSLLQGFAKGQSAVESLQQALSSLSSLLVSMASKKLVEQAFGALTGAASSALGGVTGAAGGAAAGAGAAAGGALAAGVAFSPLTFGISAAIAALGVGLGLLSSSMEKSKQKAQEAAQKAKEAADALQQAQAAWTAMSREYNDFVAAASGIKSGSLTEAVRAIRDEMEKLSKAAADAKAGGGVEAVIRSAGVEQVRRMLDEIISGTGDLGEFEKQLKDVTDQFNGLGSELLALGFSIEETADLIQRSMIASLDRLRQKITDDLAKEVNELSGKGWINQITDILKKFNELSINNLADPQVLSKWVTLALQDAVDQAELTGAAFQELLTVFPELAGRVHEFTDAAVRSARELADATRSLEDRLFAATNDTSTLAGAIADFDRRALREMQDEIKAGGENIVLLEKVLAAERLAIIERFARQAADEQRRIMEEAQKALEDFTKSIKQFVQSLKTGAGTPLSPQARFEAAQTEFDRLMSVIQSGTAQERRTAMDQITSAASSLLDAGKAFNPAGFPVLFQSVTDSLEALPEQISIQELILSELQNNTVVTQLMGDAITAALGGNLDPIKLLLNTWLPSIDQNADNAISFQEMQNAFGTTYNTGSLRQIFDMLDLNHDGILTQNELQTTNNNQTGQGNATLETMSQILTQINNLTNSQISLTNSMVTLQNTLVGLADSQYQIAYNSYQSLASLQSIQASMLEQQGYTYTLGRSAWNSAANLQFLNQKEYGGYVPFKRGGWVYGSGGMDSVRARLTPGEFVVPPDAASRHSAFLQAISSGYTAPPANDNTGLVSEVQALRKEVEALRRVSAAGHAAVAEGIGALRMVAEDQAANEKLYSAQSR